MIPRHHVRIEHDGSPYGGRVFIDGRQLHGVTYLNLEVRPRDLPRLEVGVGVYETTTYDAPAHVHIPDVTRDTLLALGWGPPDLVGALLERLDRAATTVGDYNRRKVWEREVMEAERQLRKAIAFAEASKRHAEQPQDEDGDAAN